MNWSILVKSPFHSVYFNKGVKAASLKLTRERAQKSWWHNTNMRYVKSKIASPENPRILTCDVVLPNERIYLYKPLASTNHCSLGYRVVWMSITLLRLLDWYCVLLLISSNYCNTQTHTHTHTYIYIYI